MNHLHFRKPGSFVILSMIVLTLLSCRIPAQSTEKAPAEAKPQSEPTSVPQVVVPATDIPAVPAEQATVAAQPAENNTEPATANTDVKEFSFKNIHFTYNKNLAQGASGETVPAPADPNNISPWDIPSQYEKIKFTGYILPATFLQPQVYVYPIADMSAVSEVGKSQANELKNMLAAKPVGPVKVIPFLPIFNAAQVMHSQIAYINFQNGSGIRFLSVYSQSYSLICNEQLFYTFQGISSDGKYYVSFILPVNHPSLPANSNLPQADFNKLAANYQEYLDGAVADLEKLPPSSFNPSLDTLDAMVKSLSIQ